MVENIRTTINGSLDLSELSVLVAFVASTVLLIRQLEAQAFLSNHVTKERKTIYLDVCM